VRARRARNGIVLRCRGRCARRGPRQAGARSLPAGSQPRRRGSVGVPGLRGRAARNRSRAPRRDACRCHRVDRPCRRIGRRRARHRAGAGFHDAGRPCARGASSRLTGSREHPGLMDQPPQTTATAVDENQIIAERRAKLAALRERGNAFPNDFRRDALAADLRAKYDAKTNEELEPLGIEVAVAGRMLLKRLMGKASFATIQDMTDRIQLYITADAVGAEGYDAFKHWDLGDLVGATGRVFKTRTGELSLKVTSLRLLAKALRPLPEKFHGLSDQEQRYRQRYVDLITNAESRKVFVKRSQIVQAVREFFVTRGYLEVETPMMHSIPGGAAARPFATHHNALDMKLYLR